MLSHMRIRKRGNRFIRWALLSLACLPITLLLGLVILLLSAKIAGPMDIPSSRPAIFYDQHDQYIGKWDTTNRRWTDIEKMAPSIKLATLAVEDRRFFQHHGFDFRRIAQSAFIDMRSLTKAQGASTITMQYAKNLFLSNDKTWLRKFSEMFYTMRLEMNESKKEILEGYLNTIYYGHGAYGSESAAHVYFNEKAKDLTLAQSSMLAGIPNGPSLYSPFLHYNEAKMRQKIVLNTMVKSGFLTKKRAKIAYNAPLQLAHPEKNTVKKAPYFQDAVRHELTEKLHISQKALASGGLKVYTTLDSETQNMAEYWVKHTIPAYSNIQTALIALDPKNGGVVAMVGGRDYQTSPFNRATHAKRAPGSAFKPFLYYAALRNGFTPATRLKSVPTSFSFDHGHSDYSPHNFGGYYANKPITMEQALALSDNIFAVKTHLAIGMEELVNAAHRSGITSALAPIPSLALGSKPVSVLELARGYATFANEGARIKPELITRVEDDKGRTLYEWNPQRKQVLNRQTSFVLSQMMTGIFDKRLNGYTKVTGSPVARTLSHKVAAKTGSTSSDSWMAGFTPDLVAAVWVGYDKGETINTSPDTGYAKTIWSHFFEDALKGTPKNRFHPPDGVVRVRIDPKSGLLASKGCVGRPTYFVKGTEPTVYCEEINKKSLNHSTEKKTHHSLFNRLFHWWK
ncbi:transglycosylase domain-containing protein [Sporolactobacillus kofuensis]|uniref:Transglycosylase domain-containing protein n=1 Tax=Sporolactobacillus kofuensis TaxID=269672 RepID=A0ABW1WFM7_9BACL|nr:PBP1A family penicillin-binding protein [Sporolactobacillus kofuensis]MCO7176296.1 PBP1A family penicillin-binding protein [Sporolactobacillus kofuensis]